MKCTAIDRDWGEDQPHILMHPPCACPACAPDKADAQDVAEDGWLVLSERTQRYRVENAELGATGTKLLG